MQTTILIATTNPGKYKEIVHFFSDLSFNFVSLNDLKFSAKSAPEEPYSTTWENARHKAIFYGQRSGLLTLAEDSAFCVDYLGGAPGIRSKPTDELHGNTAIIEALTGITEAKRGCSFETSACVYNPQTASFSVFTAQAKGRVVAKPAKGFRQGVGYDAIFYYPPLKKTFAELSIAEKNNVSHRGQVLNQVKIFLSNQFSFKQIVVPVGIIVKNRKLFANRRRDVRLEFNNKWEFPGGMIENGEEVLAGLRRELKEETGLTVAIKEMIPKIFTATRVFDGTGIQIFVGFYICSIKEGRVRTAPTESSGHGWFSLKEAKKLDWLPLNKKCIRQKDFQKILKVYID